MKKLIQYDEVAADDYGLLLLVRVDHHKKITIFQRKWNMLVDVFMTVFGFICTERTNKICVARH